MKKIWATGLFTLLLLVSVSPDARSQEAPPELGPVVEIYDSDGSESLDSVYQAKLTLVQAALGDAPLQPETIAAVRDALVTAFPGRTRMESAGQAYKRYWCAIQQEWVYICCGGATFVVDLGLLGRVSVHVEELIPL